SWVTSWPSAAPITTPTARSITLPRIANSRNSLTMPIGVSCVGGTAASRLRALCDGRVQLAIQRQQPVQPRAAAVARLQRGDAGRGAHEHQVPGAQRVEF